LEILVKGFLSKGDFYKSMVNLENRMKGEFKRNMKCLVKTLDLANLHTQMEGNEIRIEERM
jgi:hypothetical protein